ncbi:MAG: PDZ domain-containing protein [Rhizobacter sp.]|nr:PDZ domain-containing protein [Ferruginibacter sp.]
MRNFLIFFLCCSAKFTLAQQTDPLQQKAITLKRFMDKNHYQPLVWNDSSSERLYNKWIKWLDGEKLIFTQPDIALQEPFKNKLDDELNGGNWQFFKISAGLYRRRLLKVDSLIKNVLSKPLDFSANETLQFPFAGFAVNEAELQQRWKKYCKWQVLRSIADDNDSVNVSAADFIVAEKKAVALQKTREEKYIKRLLGDTPAEFETEWQDNYLNSIAWCYDPHSSYMNLGKKDEFETEMSASEYSIGFEIEENDKSEAVISFLQPGGSAWRSGQLHKGDILVAVKIGTAFKNITDISDDEMEEALGGTARAETEIKIRTVAGETKIVKLAKEKISNEEDVVKSYVLQGTANIGYIDLPGFYSRETGEAKAKGPNYDGCANDVSKEIVKLKKDSIAGLILDLRYNGGGSIWEAMQLAGIFIDIGPVASMKDRDGNVQFLKDPNRGTIYDGPLMVLINGASASASEFVAAVLQDYNRAVIVGGTTYGKGTAQTIKPMDTTIHPNKKYEDFVKVTGEKFYRVNGSTTQWKGVEPDIALPDMYGNEAYKERSAASALQPDISKKGVYKPFAALPVAELNGKSIQRVRGNTFFKAINNYADLTVQYQEGRTVALTWAAYLAQYKASKALFKSLDEENLPLPGHLAVRNNSFDKERISLSGGYSREVNDAYLKNVSADPVISEARNIMLDWTGKK